MSQAVLSKNDTGTVSERSDAVAQDVPQLPASGQSAPATDVSLDDPLDDPLSDIE